MIKLMNFFSEFWLATPPPETLRGFALKAVLSILDYDVLESLKVFEFFFARLPSSIVLSFFYFRELPS